MKTIFYTIVIAVAIFLSGCAKRNFYPDKDDPGLSRFTSYGYNVVTNYINGKPYINLFSLLRGNYLPVFTKLSTNSAEDTLSIYWPIEREDTSKNNNDPYQYLELWMPVSKTFSKIDFLSYNGKRIIDSCSIAVGSLGNPGAPPKGQANIYFVKIEEDKTYLNPHLKISGLFDGNIGDSILVTKGRFDFNIDESTLDF